MAENRRIERLKAILSPTSTSSFDDQIKDNEIIAKSTDSQERNIRDELDYILQDLDDDDETVHKLTTSKKDPRPDSRRLIAELAMSSSMKIVALAYPELKLNSNGNTISLGGIESRLRRWKEDYVEELRTNKLIDVTWGGGVHHV